MFKTLCIQHGRSVLLTLLLIVSGLLIAHFSIQYYYKQNLIDFIFNTNELVVTGPDLSLPDPRGGGESNIDTIPDNETKDKTVPVDNVSVEVFGLIKFELSEANSWQTIAKILVVILGTFFGMRAVNTLFNKLEKEPRKKVAR